MTAEEIRAQREQCADCGGALQEIKVRQNDHMGMNNFLSPVVYYSNETETSGRHSMWVPLPIAGVLLAFMCSRCARVSFYGAGVEPKGNAKTEPANEDR